MTGSECTRLYHKLKSSLGSTGQVGILLSDVLILQREPADWLEVLAKAAGLGDVAVVTRLLQWPEIAGRAHETSNLALKNAYSKGHVQVVEALMQVPSVLSFFSNDSYQGMHIIIHATLDAIKYLSRIPEFLVFLKEHHKNVLKFSVRRGDVPIFKHLFHMDDMKDDSDESIELLKISAEQRAVEIFDFLMSFEELQDIVHSENNAVLGAALKANCLPIVDALLKIEAVFNDFKQNPSPIISIVLHKTQYSMYQRLIAIPSIVTSLSYKELLSAITHENEPVVKHLLTLNSVKKTITGGNHIVMRHLSQVMNTEIMVAVLNHYPHVGIPFEYFARMYQNSINNVHRDQIFSVLFNRPLIVSGQYKDVKKLYAVHAWCKHWGLELFAPAKLLNDLNWSEYLYEQIKICKDPKHAAILMLCISEMAAIRKKKIRPMMMAAGDEAAMDKGRVSQCAQHFNAHVKPVYDESFIACGGVEPIERKIKEKILGKIIAHANPSLRQEIELRQNDILNGTAVALQWAREHFTDKEDIYQTAWRAYDKDAEKFGFDNLLTEPGADEIGVLHNIIETGITTELDVKSGSDIIRMRACYYYLLATDPRLTIDERETAIDAFIAAIAEICRAHNGEDKHEDNVDDIDDPSCFPGCFTHLGELSKLNPHIRPMDIHLEEAVLKYFRRELERALVKAFLRCRTKQEALMLSDALTMLSNENAWDVIKNPLKVDCESLSTGDDDFEVHPYNAELLDIRQKFINQYFDVIEMMKNFDKQQSLDTRIGIRQHDRVLMQDLISDLGCGDFSALIIRCSQARLTSIEKTQYEAVQNTSIVSITGHKRDETDDNDKEFNQNNHKDKKLKVV